MGTPCACMLATLYFGWHERMVILPEFKENIIFYRRFIDDVICIWKTTTPRNTNPNPLLQLKQRMNSFGKLRWEFTEPSDTAVFLDLEISIVNDTRRLKFKTFQKKLNLYLYIPPHSAHPPGTIRSLIFGLTRKYWQQNSDPNDFRDIIKLLYTRLLARGHNPAFLNKTFAEAALAIDEKQNKIGLDNTPTPKQTNTPDNQLFLKWQFHPRDISRHAIRKCYTDSCENESPANPNGFKSLKTASNATMEITKFTVAYTKGKNLRDILIPSTLQEFDEYKVSSFLPSETSL